MKIYAKLLDTSIKVDSILLLLDFCCNKFLIECTKKSFFFSDSSNS